MFKAIKEPEKKKNPGNSGCGPGLKMSVLLLKSCRLYIKLSMECQRSTSFLFAMQVQTCRPFLKTMTGSTDLGATLNLTLSHWNWMENTFLYVYSDTG